VPHAPAVPALPCRFRRLYPDSALAIENERLEATQAALFGVFAAHALLLAFSLKLKMSAALHQPDKLARQPGAAAAAALTAALNPINICGAAAPVCGLLDAGCL
jgi:hypothetical protein